jgi:signal transduction histidine kinase/DNA-binding response OmpR family regulator
MTKAEATFGTDEEIAYHRKIESNFRYGNICCLLGTVLYILLRLGQWCLLGKFPPRWHTLLSCGISCLVVLLLGQRILKKTTATPLFSGLCVLASFSVGSIMMSDFEYYYIGVLAIAGVISIYQNFKAIAAFYGITLLWSIILFCTVFQNAGVVEIDKMGVNALLCYFGFFFLVLQVRRSTNKDDMAEKGLEAFASLLKTTPNYTVITDEMNMVRYISDAMAAFAGLPHYGLAIGRPLLDLFDGAALKLMFADMLDAKSFYQETREIDIDNKPHYFKIISSKLTGAVQGRFIDITDVTPTVRAKNQAEEAARAADMANASKSRFLATMSHEIRTPMNAIIGIADIELQKKDLQPEKREALSRIHNSAYGLLGIINDILDFSKIESGKLELVNANYDLPSVINDTANLNMVRIGSKPIEFKLDITENLPVNLFGDELRVKQILNNILSNAFKYTDHGKVTMKVRHETKDERWRAGKTVYLTFVISDTGQGMSEEDISQLFTAYTQFNKETNHKTEGTGLGMNITYKLVKMMLGEISVQSVPGKGSTFTVTIPQQYIDDEVIGAETAERLRKFRLSDSKQAEKLQIVRDYMPYGRVLVVDDVETNLYVARGLLAPYGLQTDTADSGFETIEKVKKGNIYDIIFMDHMMPKMDGIEATKELRKMGYKEPIVALTANALVGHEKLFFENGFDDFISKPIDIRQLNTALNRWVRDRHSQEERDAAASQVKATRQKQRNDGLGAQDARLLKIFCKDAEKAVAVLEANKEGDLKLFSINAHAMKSALANIGQTKASQAAAALEKAGKVGDKGYVAKHTAAFVESLHSIIGSIKVQEVFKIVRQAAFDFDPTAIDEQLEKLGSMKLDKANSDLLEKLEELALHSEFEEIAELLK